jgi:hypothetical protein
MTIVPFDYAGMAQIADELIQEFGMKATLRRNGTQDRDCYVAIIEYQPKDAATQLANPTDRVVLIDPLFGGVPAMPPDWERDQLVTYVQPPGTPPVGNEILSFTMPVKPISPAGIVVVYQTSVRR